MKKQDKKVEAVSFEGLKQIILADAKAADGKLSQEKVDNYLTNYDLDDALAEELLSFITDNNINITDDLDDLDIDDEALLSDVPDVGDLDVDVDLDDDDSPDLDFAGDFDMMTGDTLNMYHSKDDQEEEDNQLGSNVKINDPVKMYLKKLEE